MNSTNDFIFTLLSVFCPHLISMYLWIKKKRSLYPQRKIRGKDGKMVENLKTISLIWFSFLIPVIAFMECLQSLILILIHYQKCSIETKQIFFPFNTCRNEAKQGCKLRGMYLNINPFHCLGHSRYLVKITRRNINDCPTY